MMLKRNAIVGVAISFALTVNISKAYAINCPANSEPWDAETKCRCVTGYIENQKRCVELNLGTANVRARELKNMEMTSDCRAMSRILTAFSRAVGLNAEELATYAGRILSIDGVPHLIRPVSKEYVVLFKDSGFRPEYRQPNNNQVRHFVGYFALGIFKANGLLDDPLYAAILAEWREEVQADIDLGNVAFALGRQAAGAPHMMENIGTSIRSQVCN